MNEPLGDSSSDSSPSDSTEVSSASRQIKAAQAGDLEALAPVIESVSPFLLALAKSRLGTIHQLDPEDIVQDAWAVGIRRLPDLVAHDGRLSAVLFRFLSSTITRRVNDLLRQAVRQKQGFGGEDSPQDKRQPEPEAPHTEVFKKAVHTEMCLKVLELLEALPDADRELFLRRALEGLAYPLIGRLLNEAPNTLAKRYQRMRADLREALDMALLDEFLE